MPCFVFRSPRTEGARRATEVRGERCRAGRPYKRDDNAHLEQKNWTHVRRLLGYVRYDSPEAREAINDLYRQELRLFQNLFLPSVKPAKKERVGSRLPRRYEAPGTPFQRVMDSPALDAQRGAELRRQREKLGPFQLSQILQAKLERIFQLSTNVKENGELPTAPPQRETVLERKAHRRARQSKSRARRKR